MGKRDGGGLEDMYDGRMNSGGALTGCIDRVH